MIKIKTKIVLNIPKNVTDRRAMGETAKEIRKVVLARVEKEIDLRGGKFKRYSPSYRASKGQLNVDLKRTGDMLKNFRTRNLKSNSVSVGYRTAKRIKKVRLVQLVRMFVGLTNKEIKKITKFLNGQVSRIINTKQN